jgi:beta-glucosidase/6-phospho-beta-glucosidase/beta-galactosidase
VRTPTDFLWATGIEDTFITAPHPLTGRILDEYELTGHYAKWREDLDRIAELGVSAARYGVPWYLMNPSPARWDWSFVDRTLDHLLDRGVQPIVDLIHYGLPSWMGDAFLSPDFPARAAEFSARLADRFKGRIFYYTPLNEPRVTAWYCGRLGWWPPFMKSWKGFLTVLIAVCRGIVRIVEALRAVDPRIVPVHVDATDLYETQDPALTDETERRQEIVFLALDLISGRVGPDHPLHGWFHTLGGTDEDLTYFREHRLELNLLGINLYPMFSRKIVARVSGTVRLKMPYASAEIIESLGQLYWNRYHCPLFIAETASVGSLSRRRKWLDDSVEAARNLRKSGVPLVGYTWWPLFALVTWAYRQGTHPPAYYLKQMGLWDLDASSAELDRIRTPLVNRFAQLTAAGATAVGPVHVGSTERMAHVS